MAKINVYETTKEVSDNAKNLANKVKALKADVDSYVHLVNDTKEKLKKEQEEQKKAEAATLERKKREEEHQRKVLDAQAEKAKKDSAAKAKKDSAAKEAKAASEKLATKEKEDPKVPVEQQVQQQPSVQAEQKGTGNPPPKQQGASNAPKQQGASNAPRQQGAGNPPPRQQGTSNVPRQQGASTAPRQQKPGSTPRKPQGDGRPQKSATVDRKSPNIVDKFLSQPPVVNEKEKQEVNKGVASKGFVQTKDKNRKNKKDMWQESNPNSLYKGKQRYKKGNKPKQPVQPAPERKKAITMGDIITVKELSEKIGIQVSEIIKKLMGLGILATINKELDYDTAYLIATEFKVELERKSVKSYEEILGDEDTEDAPENLVERPPVITVMGHVDHGKTSLLDAIRNSKVTEGEAGGITQHIGAYTVTVKNKSITFLDTPGHEAFTSMRARGAKVTDTAILVVAADDGVMPQTIEAINHAKAANVPIIVAINKMDKPGANADRVKQELTEHGLVVEEWGGDTIAVPVSAINREGIDTLLDMIILVAEMNEFRANPNRLARGTIVEAQLDKGRGPVATILVQNGSLKIGDSIVAGTTYGRVRAMTDDKGKRIKIAGPSIPVEVIGLSDVPEAGDVMYAVEGDKLAKQVSEERKDKVKKQQISINSRTSLDDLFSQMKEGEVKDLNLIIKADVQGSVEAVKQALEKLSSSEVRVRNIHGGVGAITESDVMLATASNAIIIGFNVRPSVNAIELAEKEKVDIRAYRIIYKAIEDIQAAMLGMLDPEFKEVVIGHIQVRAIFKVSGVGTIAGSYVTDGKITRNASARVVRDGVVVHEGAIDSLKRFKDDAKEVASGYECGIGLDNFNDLKEGDIIEAFIQEEIIR